MFGRTIATQSAASAAAERQGMAAYQTNQPGLHWQLSRAQHAQALRDAKRDAKRIAAGFTMPSSRGGSAVPTPQEQAVVEEVIESSSPTQDDIYLEAEGWTSPMDVPELDMVLVEEPKKISPMIYALGAGVLLLGGFLLFRN